MSTLNMKPAVLALLYARHPSETCNQFIEIRRWETPDGSHLELVVESGRLDLFGELQTKCEVYPFHLSLEEIVQMVTNR